MMTLLSFALAMLVTSALLPTLRTHGARLGLVDDPREPRRVHQVVTPHSGGIAIVAGVAVAAAVWVPWELKYLGLLACVALIVGLGLLDDLFGLDYRIKFMGQGLAVCGLLWAYGGLSQVPFFALDSAPTWLAMAFSFVFALGVTNAVNLSDGLDGLAAGNGLLSLGMLALFAAQINEAGYLAIALAMAGGLVGFLRFNSHPASIFMGDTGSQFIGFTAAALTILILQGDNTPFSPLIPILIFGLPILDTLSVMTIRKFRGRPVFAADRSHLHHQLLRIGFRHYEVVIILYGLQAICMGLAYQLRYAADITVLAGYIVFAALALVPILIARLTDWRAHPPANVAGFERRNLLLRKFSWYHENTARVIAGALVGLFLFCNWQAEPATQQIATYAGITAISLVILWVLLRNNIRAVSRVICYFASIAAVYCALFNEGPQAYLPWLDLSLVALTGALVLAIRITRRTLFHLDTQDYLVLFIVAIAPLLIPDGVDGRLATRGVLYIAVLLYASEYVISKGNKTRWLINGAGTTSLALIAI